MAAEEKQRLEKKKVKAQYEQFMSMKKQTDAHPDKETLQQYSDLNSDIQSLLASIHQGQQATTTAAIVDAGNNNGRRKT